MGANYERSEKIVAHARGVTDIDEPTAVTNALVAAVVFMAWFHSDHPKMVLACVRDEIQRQIDVMPDHIADKGKDGHA